MSDVKKESSNELNDKLRDVVRSIIQKGVQEETDYGSKLNKEQTKKQIEQFTKEHTKLTLDILEKNIDKKGLGYLDSIKNKLNKHDVSKGNFHSSTAVEISKKEVPSGIAVITVVRDGEDVSLLQAIGMNSIEAISTYENLIKATAEELVNKNGMTVDEISKYIRENYKPSNETIDDEEED